MVSGSARKRPLHLPGGQNFDRPRSNVFVDFIGSSLGLSRAVKSSKSSKRVTERRREEGSSFEMSELYVERAGVGVERHDDEDDAGVCKYALDGVCIEGGIDASGRKSSTCVRKHPRVMILV